MKYCLFCEAQVPSSGLLRHQKTVRAHDHREGRYTFNVVGRKITWHVCRDEVACRRRIQVRRCQEALEKPDA